MKVIFFIIMLTSISQATHASKGRGGGDTVLDPVTERRTLLDLVEEDDTYPVNLSSKMFDERLHRDIYYYYFTGMLRNEYVYYRKAFGNSAFTYFFMSSAGYNWEPCKMKQSNDCYLNTTSDSYLQFLQTTKLKAKKIDWYFTTTDLEEINDEGLISFEDISSKKQVAAQIDGKVIINEYEFNKLDDRSKTALIIHEQVLYTVLNLNPDLVKDKGTAPIRKFVRRLIKKIDAYNNNLPNIPDSWVLESFQQLGLK